MAMIGIDYGGARVGLAVAEDGHAHRYGILKNDEGLLDTLAAYIENHNVDTVVLGLPRNLDGDDTPQTTVVRQFAEDLVHRIPAIKLILQDEAGTSGVARERLLAEGVGREELKNYVDAEAAAVILEDYLHEH